MLDNGMNCSKPRDKRKPHRSHNPGTFYNIRYKNQLESQYDGLKALTTKHDCLSLSSGPHDGRRVLTST